jgi:hypothetical protein
MFVPCDAADDVIDRGKRHVERYDDPKVAAAAEPQNNSGFSSALARRS